MGTSGVKIKTSRADGGTVVSERKVQVFFYGSFMSLPMLEAAGIAKRAFAPASVTGFELVIAPHANLVDSGDGVVFGILANLNHHELIQLYKTHALKQTDVPYLPEAVMVHTRGGKMVPAMVYIAAQETNGKPDPAYLKLMTDAARNYGFPKWYQEHIAAFGG